ncbi:DUF7365 family protein [Staphylococcus gallinarum]|uniref:DUF7365 family protein n=1 Tax=Staphylococcus gallinarum TaxID=1293 RepID=UPI000D1FBC6E|nr:hypothetical protein [Staphylococcus gallinarum]MBU7217841.1 hypothetical protein [Staphylococcus gallinarum]MCD8821178.1 hypothetical protein [Staphylococcus gallinarum]PTK88447.1 hypothetical protein BUZ13_13350 [Staphylococcus gallinarum]PTK94116.1 hypothetical protein BUZ05_05725 [Staphylococcus gallinarum]
MNASELTYWIIFTVVPLVVTVVGLFLKVGKDKRDNENRITRIESEVREHRRDISDVKESIERQREETKIILEVSSKIDTLTTRFDNFENRFYSNQSHN